MKIFRLFSFIVLLGLSAPAQDLVVGHVARSDQRDALAEAPNLRRNVQFSAVTPQQRRQAIDQIWGPGATTAEKLQIFDTFWNRVDSEFAAFQGLDVDWDALRAHYRPEIEAGVSRGRFAAIMNRLSLALRDSHTSVMDIDVNLATLPQPGVPLLAVGAWGNVPSGVCSTAQPDGSALIYAAAANHPLGLRRGDRVIGYDGRPWTELYNELIQEELPLWPFFWGSSPSAYEHSWVMSATLNWHLFQTIDIAKANGTIVHVPTSLMTGPIWFGRCTEQMSIPGVPRPTGISGTQSVRAGIIQGTRIGYVYNWAWTAQSEVTFANAIYNLTYIQRVDALIIDLRFNIGGSLLAPQLGSAVLFRRPAPTIGLDRRRDRAGHLDMRNLFTPSEFIMDFDYFPERELIHESFNGPIAVLVGPGSLSAGDISSLWLTYHPRVRTFGKSTASAFNIPTQPGAGNDIDFGPDWFAALAFGNIYRVEAPNAYLTRTEFPVDEPIWLTPQDVAAGQDTVVNAAKAWIAQQTAP